MQNLVTLCREDNVISYLITLSYLDNMANDAPVRNGQSIAQSGESGRLSNIQRIAQRKQQVRGFALHKKLEKLAVYSSCKVFSPYISCYIASVVSDFVWLTCISSLWVIISVRRTSVRTPNSGIPWK